MIKKILLILALPFACFGDWHLNDDCTVNFKDFAIFAADWQTIHDYEDLASFASEWLDQKFYCNESAPVATGATIAAMQYVPQIITMTATDGDNLPKPPKHIKYQLTQLPANGYVQTLLALTANKFTTVPAWNVGWDNRLIFASDTVGEHTLKFKAYDGMAYSDEATITLNVAACTVDSVAFDGTATSYISIPDGTYLDIVDGWAIDFWLNTREPDFDIIEKRDGGAGYKISLVGGVPKIQIWDADGATASLDGNYAVNSGYWAEIEFAFNTTATGIRFYVGQDGYISGPYNTDGTFVSFENSEPVIIKGHGNFDKLRFFSGITDAGGVASIIQGLSSRTQSANEQVFDFGAISSVLFMCDEGSGTTITDMKTGKVGTFSDSDHIKWQSYYWDWNNNQMQKVVGL